MSEAGAPLIEVEAATFADAGLMAARDVTLTVAPGAMVVVHGGESSGKSTLLRGLLGFVPLVAGSARLFGTDIAKLAHHEWMLLRARCAYASWTSPLLANLTIYDNLAIPLLMRSISEGNARADVERVLAMLNLDGVALKRPHEVLGHQQRAALIGRALILPSELVLVDDPPEDKEIDAALQDAREQGRAILIASRTPERFRDAVQVDLLSSA